MPPAGRFPGRIPRDIPPATAGQACAGGHAAAAPFDDVSAARVPWTMTEVLILRPQPGAAASGARAEAAGFAVTTAPLFVVRPVAWRPPDPADFDALLLTSANAPRHAGAGLAAYRGMPAYAVGRATAAAAAAAGLRVAATGEADGPALAAVARGHGVSRALHLAGRDHRLLALPGFHVVTVPVYEAVAAAALPPEAIAALARGAVALLHSPRAAALFRGLCDTAGIAPATARIAVIGARAADAAGPGWAAVAVATHPRDDALLAAAAGLCDQGGGRDH